ncbi:Polymer-forming cytoskeletal [Serratia rubidaea]|nr:Polymer-forming cytoskeletal [Serratia rubidaea]
MQLFNKSKKNPTDKSGKKTDDAKPPHNDMKEPVKTAPAPPPLAELLESSKPVKAIKDTFVSQGTQLTGTIEGQGNIIVEGVIEGSLTCSHQVRIEPTGHVKGEIHAQHIMINGSVEGSCHADSLTIQPKGHMRGDIFTDEFSIEKGGVFVGQSQLMPQTAAGAGKVTALKTARPAPADAAPQLQEPQQVK